MTDAPDLCAMSWSAVATVDEYALMIEWRRCERAPRALGHIGLIRSARHHAASVAAASPSGSADGYAFRLAYATQEPRWFVLFDRRVPPLRVQHWETKH